MHRYKLTYTWAGGFYCATRTYKHLQSALDAFVLYCDMLTETVELRNRLTGQLLADHTGYRAAGIENRRAMLLTVGGDKREVTL